MYIDKISWETYEKSRECRSINAADGEGLNSGETAGGERKTRQYTKNQLMFKIMNQRRLYKLWTWETYEKSCECRSINVADGEGLNSGESGGESPGNVLKNKTIYSDYIEKNIWRTRWNVII